MPFLIPFKPESLVQIDDFANKHLLGVPQHLHLTNSYHRVYILECHKQLLLFLSKIPYIINASCLDIKQ